MSSISRSEFQKLAEENKRLRADLKVICTGDSFESIEKRQEYRKLFERKKVIGDLFKIIACQINSDNKPILHLNLKSKWFEMIEQGVKLEEYRDITDYWVRIFKTYQIKIKGKFYDPSEIIICFSNGFKKNRKQLLVECTGLKVDYGHPEWGAMDFTKYHVLSLGQIILKLNCN